MKLKVQYENHYYDEMEEMEEELLAKLGEHRHKTGRPIRFVCLLSYSSLVHLQHLVHPPHHTFPSAILYVREGLNGKKNVFFWALPE